MLFKDQRLHDEYEQNGYVVIPFLNQKELNELKQLYLSIYSADVKGLYTTHSHSSGARNIQLHREIGNIMQGAMENIFIDFEYVVNHFVVKSHIVSDELRLHQDWSIVNEAITPIAQLWCPLTDTDETNGGMFAINGSHLFFNNLRSGSLGMAFINRTPYINSRVTTFKVKAGEAFVFKMALFHGSFPNQSSQPRMVAFGSMVRKNQPWVYYQKRFDYDKCKIVDVYAMNTETFLTELAYYEKGIKPSDALLIESFVNTRIETSAINDEFFAKRLAGMDEKVL